MGTVPFEGRALLRSEIKELWAIDRREVIEAVYYLVDGALVLKPEHHDLHGWPPGEAAKYTPLLEACYDQGGWFHGLFDNKTLVGAAVLDNRYIGKNHDQLQLAFLHVSQGDRQKGLGTHLFSLAATQARRRGARGMYISATPSERTIQFYLRRGCKVSLAPDARLFALEPNDIHLEYDLVPVGK